MTTSPIEKAKQAVEKKGDMLSIEGLIQKSAEQLGKALPLHMRSERIVRIALTTLRLNPKLMACDPYSFLGALFQAAQLGLEPNVEGQAYIIPYGNKAQFQLGYKGLVELYYRHPNSISLQAEAVREHDDFVFDLAKAEISHKIDLSLEDRGKVIAYYAVAKMVNGGNAFKVMSFNEVKQFAERFSKCYMKKEQRFMPDTPWANNFDEMAKKSVLKQLMKLLPKSVEMQQALAMDETVKTIKPEQLKNVTDMIQVPNEAEYLSDEPKTIETTSHELGD